MIKIAFVQIKNLWEKKTIVTRDYQKKSRRGEENFVDREALIENFPFFATRNSLARSRPPPQIVLQKRQTLWKPMKIFIFIQRHKRVDKNNLNHTK